MEPATLDVEKQIVFHMLEAAKGFQTLIYEAPEDLDLTNLINTRYILLNWCETILPSKPSYGGENVVPISNHPRFRVAG